MPSRRELRLLRGAKAAPCVARRARRDLLHGSQEQPKRFADITALFHREGMCGDVIFYRPGRGRFDARHLDLASRGRARSVTARTEQDPGARGRHTISCAPWTSTLDSIRKARRGCRADGLRSTSAIPRCKAISSGSGLMRVSRCDHARLCRQQAPAGLAGCDPADGPLCAVRSRLIGFGIDGAFACLPGMFALFPMKIMQRRVEEVRSYEERPRWVPQHYRLFSLVEGAWLRQWIAAALSPLHWLSCAFPRSALDCSARRSRRRLVGFSTPTITSPISRHRGPGRATLEHFIRFGSNEYRNPNAWFNTTGT